jgi:hypothetical protein
MGEPSRRWPLTGRVVAWSLAWLFSAALYLLLIDTTDLPELFVAVAAAAIAATGFELARRREITGLATRLRWLARLHRPLLAAPADIVVVSVSALRQLARPRRTVGVFRAVPFHRGEDEALETGRAALAESLGSFAPNTIVIGVDRDRELLLAHQLHRSGGEEAVDLLGLG